MSGKPPYDQRLARWIIRPFAHSALHPNHLTTLTLLLGLSSAGLFAFQTRHLAWLAALLYMLAVFSDHLDGELARMANKTSWFGYRYDYLVGGLNYTLLYISCGYGLYQITGIGLLLILGLAAGLSNPVILFLRMRMEALFGSKSVEHPGYVGFEIEDFIYLIGPLTWFFDLRVFFIPYAVGALAYLGWTIIEYFHWRTVKKSTG